MCPIMEPTFGEVGKNDYLCADNGRNGPSSEGFLWHFFQDIDYLY